MADSNIPGLFLTMVKQITPAIGIIAINNNYRLVLISIISIMLFYFLKILIFGIFLNNCVKRGLVPTELDAKNLLVKFAQDQKQDMKAGTLSGQRKKKKSKNDKRN